MISNIIPAANVRFLNPGRLVSKAINNNAVIQLTGNMIKSRIFDKIKYIDGRYIIVLAFFTTANVDDLWLFTVKVIRLETQ